MPILKQQRVVRSQVYAMALSLLAAAAQANPYVLGGGFAADDAGGFSLNALADVSLAERTWLTLSGGTSTGETLVDELRSSSFEFGLTQQFDVFGLKLGGGYWGDADLVDTRDIEAGIFWRPGPWRFALDYERRDIDLTFVVAPLDPALQPQRVSGSLDARGIGASVRYRTRSNTSFFLAASDYDYSRDISRLGILDLVRRVSPTTLTLAGSLRDFHYSAAIDWEEGDYLFGIELTQERLAIGELDITSFTGSVLLPVAPRMDLELSLGFSNSDDADSGAYAGLFLFFYGG